MFKYIERDQGMSGVADEPMISGMLATYTMQADGLLHFRKVKSLADLVGRKFGVIYVDHEKKSNRRPVHLDNRSLESNEAQEIAAGESCTLLYGRIRGMSNQLTTGFYNPGDDLTIDVASAVLRHADAGESIYARIPLEFGGGRVVKDGDTLAPVFLSVPEALVVVPAAPEEPEAAE